MDSTVTNNPNITIVPSIYKLNNRFMTAEPGTSLASILATAELPEGGEYRYIINGKLILNPESIRLRSGDIVVVRAIPQGGDGGKNIMRSVLMVAVVALAWQAAPYLADFAVGGFATAGQISLAGALISTAGLLAVNAFMPPAIPETNAQSSKDAQLYSVGASSNGLNPYGVIPQVLGKVRWTPPFAFIPFTEIIGDDQYITLGFELGYGPLNNTLAKFGETIINYTNFNNFEYEIKSGFDSDTAISLVPDIVVEDSSGSTLTYNVAIVKTTTTNIDRISVDIEFPGLAQVNNDGSKTNTSVDFEILYAPTGTTTWNPIGITSTSVAQQTIQTLEPHFVGNKSYVYLNLMTGVASVSVDVLSQAESLILIANVSKPEVDWLITATGLGIEYFSNPSDFTPSINAATGLVTITAGHCSFPIRVTAALTRLVRRNVTFDVPLGHYDVKITRKTVDSTSDQLLNTSNWTKLRSIKTNSTPFNARHNTSRIVLRIKATEQFNGGIDPFTIVSSLYCLDFDGDVTWALAETSNPASLCRYVLEGYANQNAGAEYDLVSLEDFHIHCVTNGFHYNKVIGENSLGVEGILNEICAAGRGRCMEIDGKYRFIFDTETLTASQLYNPRNSWGFKSTRIFPELPHGFKVKYQNEDEDWREDEIEIYAPGYNEGTATLFETFEFPGVTSFGEIHKHAWYHLATLVYRPETITIQADFENMPNLPGNLIKYQDDIMAIGLGAARIKSLTVVTGVVEDILFDNAFQVDGLTVYYADFRTVNTSTTKIEITSELALTPYLSESGMIDRFVPVDELLEANSPIVGDLMHIGPFGSVSLDLLIKWIVPGADMSASLVCVEQAPEVYTYAGGTLPAYISHVSNNYVLLPPTNLKISVDTAIILNDAWRPTSPRSPNATITWEYPLATLKPEGFVCEIKRQGSDEAWQSITVNAGLYRADFQMLSVGIYEARVRAFGATSSTWTTHTFEVLGVYGGADYDGTLIAPVNPTIYFTPNSTEIANIKFSSGYTEGKTAADGVAFFYAMETESNSAVIDSYSNPDIIISSSEVLDSGSMLPSDLPYHIYGSSAGNAVSITTLAVPLDTTFNLHGMWWVAIDATGRSAGTSQWQKVVSIDTTTLYFAEDFTVSPQVGDTLLYLEAAYHDTRLFGSRQIVVVDGGNDYEIINYGDVSMESGIFGFRDCTRGAEGTTPLGSLNGLTAQHYAGPGGGESKLLVFPASEFQQPTAGVLTCSLPVNLTVIADIKWVSMSCCTFKKTIGNDGLEKFTRSALIPVVYGGPL